MNTSYPPALGAPAANPAATDPSRVRTCRVYRNVRRTVVMPAGLDTRLAAYMRAHKLTLSAAVRRLLLAGLAAAGTPD